MVVGIDEVLDTLFILCMDVPTFPTQRTALEFLNLF